MKTKPTSMALCPLNFQAFNGLISRVGDIEAALLFSKLRFHHRYTRIKKYGKLWIVRTRQELASWFGLGIKKVDRLLHLLEDKGLIEKKADLWHGTKKLFITIAPSEEHIPVNIGMMEELIKITGSLTSALLFSRIAYGCANTKIIREEKGWFAMAKDKLSLWLGTSVRTVHTLIDGLLRKGLLLKKNFNFHNKTQSHFHIPAIAIDVITKRDQEAKEEKQKKGKVAEVRANSEEHDTKNTQGSVYTEPSAKAALSIRRDLPLKKSNNSHSKGLSTNNKCNLSSKEDDISFNQLKDSLSEDQEKYLHAALDRTKTRFNLHFSSPDELWAQIVFAITNKAQLVGVTSFKHAVNRIMKIISSKNWRTPKGFFNHAKDGQVYLDAICEREKSWGKDDQVLQSEETVAPSFIDETKPLVALEKQVPNNDNATLTELAVTLAKRIKALDSEPNKEKASNLMTYLLDKLTQLIASGADSHAVKACLMTS